MTVTDLATTHVAAGLWFDQCEPGLELRHAITRTVTETDNLLFTALSHNLQPLHLDTVQAGETEFGGILVNSMYTYALMVGISVLETTHGTVLANLGLDKLRTPAPVRIGDTLRVVTTIIDRRESRSRIDAGIVTFAHRMFNQHGDLVASAERTALMRRRPG